MATAQASGPPPAPLEKPVLEIREHMRPGSFLVPLPNKEVLATEAGDHTILRVASNGSHKQEPLADTRDIIYGLALQDDKLLMVNEEGSISGFPLKNLRDVNSSVRWSDDSDCYQIVSAAMLSRDLFVLLGQDRTMYSCSLKSGGGQAKFEKKVTGMDFDNCKVACTGTGADAKIAVVNATTNVVNIVSASTWKLQSSIGSAAGLKGPTACLFLPWGNVLVADTNNNRVSEYRCDGQLVRHWVTADQGVKSPHAIAFVSPHLWVAHHIGPGNEPISRFQIFK